MIGTVTTAAPVTVSFNGTYNVAGLYVQNDPSSGGNLQVTLVGVDKGTITSSTGNYKVLTPGTGINFVFNLGALQCVVLTALTATCTAYCFDTVIGRGD